ncbi:MAG: polysaccharide deacetylase family protein [Candidatus Aerophobetes bacterium]|nr:polysaccharide deacetylase family protein [Candidatus Aerophobetes bacterium]
MYTPKSSSLVHLSLRHPVIMVTVLSLALFLSFGKEPQPIITISFDNGYESIYTKALPILERYELPATLFVTTGNVEKEGYLKLEQLKALQEAGWEIGSYTVSSPSLVNISEANLHAELYLSRQALQGWGFPGDSFALPFGQANIRVWEYAKALYKVSRGYEPGLNKRPFPQHNLKSIVSMADTKIEEVKDWIDRCVEEKAWLVLVFHRIGEDGQHDNSSEEFLEEVCKYIKGKGKITVSSLSYAKQNDATVEELVQKP